MLWDVPFPQMTTQVHNFTECVCLSVMLFWLVPSSGTTWSANTRSERFRERSSQLARSSRRRPEPSETMEFSWDIWPEMTTLTCTKNTEILLSAELSPKCTWRCLVDTVLEVIPSKSLEQASSQTTSSDVLTSASSLETSDSQRPTNVSVPQPRLSLPESELWDQLWCHEHERLHKLSLLLAWNLWQFWFPQHGFQSHNSRNHLKTAFRQEKAHEQPFRQNGSIHVLFKGAKHRCTSFA